MLEETAIRAKLEGVRKALSQASPRIESFQFSLGQDHLGEEAIFVYVILENPKKASYSWNDLQPIHEAITVALREMDPFIWPYVRFRLASEQAALMES